MIYSTLACAVSVHPAVTVTVSFTVGQRDSEADVTVLELDYNLQKLDQATRTWQACACETLQD